MIGKEDIVFTIFTASSLVYKWTQRFIEVMFCKWNLSLECSITWTFLSTEKSGRQLTKILISVSPFLSFHQSTIPLSLTGEIYCATVLYNKTIWVVFEWRHNRTDPIDTDTVCIRDLDLILVSKKQDDYFQVTFDHFWSELYFMRQRRQLQNMARA